SRSTGVESTGSTGRKSGEVPMEKSSEVPAALSTLAALPLRPALLLAHLAFHQSCRRDLASVRPHEGHGTTGLCKVTPRSSVRQSSTGFGQRAQRVPQEVRIFAGVPAMKALGNV